ncbi:MAG: hypothetical protein IPL78_24595 [Chloroflexi bacterium]|nr:hypothetical protein [Chloroflexota bacterium]
MNNEQALVPVEQKTVEFYGDELQGLVVITHDRERAVYVPVRPLCDFFRGRLDMGRGDELIVILSWLKKCDR